VEAVAGAEYTAVVVGATADELTSTEEDDLEEEEATSEDVAAAEVDVTTAVVVADAPGTVTPTDPHSFCANARVLA